MNRNVFYLWGDTPALHFAGEYLKKHGIAVAAEPTKEVTHLLLSVPSLDAQGQLKGGSSAEEVLSKLPKDITVLGGNLQDVPLGGRRCMDLLQDPVYLAQNAAITADCALRIAGSNLPVVFDGCPMLVIGWGRIGKCLACKLKYAGAEVAVAARKEADRATVASLGFTPRNADSLDFGLSHYRVIFNTAPAPVLTAQQAAHCREGCILIDLASRQGIFSDTVIWARGLPGRDAPESSGELIAKTALRLAEGKENGL